MAWFFFWMGIPASFHKSRYYWFRNKVGRFWSSGMWLHFSAGVIPFKTTRHVTLECKANWLLGEVVHENWQLVRKTIWAKYNKILCCSDTGFEWFILYVRLFTFHHNHRRCSSYVRDKKECFTWKHEQTDAVQQRDVNQTSFFRILYYFYSLFYRFQRI